MRRTVAACFLFCLSSALAAQDSRIDATDGLSALGAIPCSALPNVAPTSCPFEVLRKAEGAATVRVLLPGGSIRSLYFQDGTLDGTDSTSATSVARQGQIQIVTVGENELFEIPDKVFTGNN